MTLKQKKMPDTFVFGSITIMDCYFLESVKVFLLLGTI